MAEELEDAPWMAPQPTAGEQPSDLPDAPWDNEPSRPRAWADVPLEAAKSAPHSALEFGKNIVQPFIHPIDTAQNLGAIGGGVLQYLGAMGGEEYKPYANAVGKFLMDRYGSVEGIKNTLATDPVGIAADVSMVLTGGSMAAARAPGLAAKLGTAARLTDPLTPVIAGAKGVGQVLGRGAAEAAGVTTHVGSEPFIQAAKAGYEGANAAKTFRENISGVAPLEEAVDDAVKATRGLRRERGNEYLGGMDAVAADKTPLDFNKVDQALVDITGVQTYKGQVLNDKTQKIRGEIGQAVAEWKVLPKAEYHTAAGLDALKRKIGDIRDGTTWGTPERVVADKAYRAIRDTIVDQVPEYGKVMRGYEQATKQIKEIEGALSLPNPDKGRIDTALRKLQSTLRNNVNTSFAHRQQLAQFLVDNGAPNLMYKLAGQALNPLAPRGLGRLALTVGGEMAGLFGLATGHVGAAALAQVAPMAAVMSPRLMGETAYWGGAGARQAAKLPGGMGRPSAAVGRVSERGAVGLPAVAGEQQQPNPRAQAASDAFRAGKISASDVMGAAQRALAAGKSRAEVERVLRQHGLSLPTVPQSQ